MKVFWVILVLGVAANLAAYSQELTKVEGKAIIFFAPSPQEYEGFSEQEQQEAEKAVSDMQFYRDQVNAFLQAHKIQDVWAVSPKIQIAHSSNGPILLERKDFQEPVGLIMTDGQRNPKMSSGVSTYIELVLMIRRYFRLKEAD